MELRHIASHQGRLSSFLKREMGMSTGLVNRLKWQDRLFVNGKCQHTDYTVMPGDVITVPLEEPTPQYPAEPGPLTVLYEDAHLLAVDKPTGMLIHPSRATVTGTLANRVLAYYQRTGQRSAFHPVTRLDRDTFGIVLLAKNAHIHARMNDLHAGGLLRKLYHARVWGGPEGEDGRIEAPIARRPLPSLLRYVNREGKPSVTDYHVLQREQDTCVMQLSPITGRTHQLRVHCAYMGFPIVGDPQYGTQESMAYSLEKGIQTQLLCAKHLEFVHPMTGEPLCLESQMDV